MTCIKTGTDVYFHAQGYVARTDVYEVGGTYIFRWNTMSIQYCLPQSCLEGTWYVSNYEDFQAWHREDIGVTVANKHFVSPGDRC